MSDRVWNAENRKTEERKRANQWGLFDLARVCTGLVRLGLRERDANQNIGVNLSGIGHVTQTGLIGKHAAHGISFVELDNGR